MSNAFWLGSMPPLWLQAVVAGSWVGAVILLAEVLSHWKLAGPELVRKIVHIGIGNVIVLAWWLQFPTWLGVGASALFCLVTLLSYRYPVLPGINSVGRKSLGTFFYALSFGVLIALFWERHSPFAALGILVMSWGDGLAALVGQKWGQHPYELGGMKKSWEGSIAMAVVSFTVSSLVLLVSQGNSWQVWATAAGVAIAASVLEAFSRFGVDNLTVPLGSATLAFLLWNTFL